VAHIEEVDERREIDVHLRQRRVDGDRFLRALLSRRSVPE
jgi:hypothetical protein